MQADPTVFQRTTTPQITVKTTTRTNPDGSKDVVDQNGNILQHIPAPPNAAPTPTVAPANLGSITPTAPTAVMPPPPTGPKPFNPNDPSTYTVRHNADGSTDYLDLSGNVAQHANPPTGLQPGGAPGGTASGAPPGAQPLFGYNTPGLDLSGQTQPQQTIAPGDQAAAAADAQAAMNEIVQWKLDHFGASADALRDAEAAIRARHPLGSAAMATSSSGGAFSDPTFASSQSNQALINRTVAQTTGDIARVSSAGATAQQGLTAAGQTAAATGQAIDSRAQADKLAALARGDAGLSTAINQGNQTVRTAEATAAPLTGLGNFDVGNGNVARAQSGAALGAANDSLSSAATSVQRLQQLAAAGDPAATAALTNFSGNAGTAGALNSMPTGVEATGRLGTIAPSTGDAARLEGLATDAGATGTLGRFGGSAGTADRLSDLPTTLSTTNQAQNFNAAPGEAVQLGRVLNTNAQATGELGQFGGSAGTAPALASFDTATGATKELGQFGPGGVSDLATLQKLAKGGDIGSSAAEALLKKNNDTILAQNVALARSGRGAGTTAANLRGAVFANAAQEQQAGNDMAALRAQEAATARGQNITAATSAAGTATTQSAQTLDALKAKQAAETTSTQQKLDALVASGQMTQQQASQQLDALKSKQQGELASIAQKSTNLATAGQQEQVASGQQLDALRVAQAGELASLTTKVNALVASGQMTQQQASQQLDALKAQQQGQLQSISQVSSNVATAGAQRQVASAQSIDALKAQQQGELAAETDRLNALVAAGQMTQAQAAQQLSALQSAQQGQLTSQQTRVTASTGAGSTANASAATSADIGKAMASIGLNYDVQSGNAYNSAGQLVMTGQQIAATLTGSGLTNQAAQGGNAANVTAQGVQALTTLTNTSVDAQKAASVLGVQTAAAITSLSQGELSELQGIVQSQNAMALQKWATDKGISLQMDQNNAQQTAAIFGAFGVITGGISTAIGKAAASNA